MAVAHNIPLIMAHSQMRGSQTPPTPCIYFKHIQINLVDLQPH